MTGAPTDALADVLRATPPQRQPDLVLLCNGAARERVADVLGEAGGSADHGRLPLSSACSAPGALTDTRCGRSRARRSRDRTPRRPPSSSSAWGRGAR